MFRNTTFILLSLVLLVKCKPLEGSSEILDQKPSRGTDQQSFIASSDGTYNVIVKAEKASYFSLSNTFKKSKLTIKGKDADYMALTVTKDELDELTSSDLRVEQDHEVHIYDNFVFENATNIQHDQQRRRLAEYLPWNIKNVLQNVAFFKNAVPKGYVKICITDTGYTYGHEDLPTNVLGSSAVGGSWRYDGNGHGTHVAGTIAGKGSNGKGVYGVIPNNYGGKFKLIISKAFDASGSSSQSTILAAVKNCVSQGANVISMSLGCIGCYSYSENEIYNDYYSQGIHIVAAAGNAGNSEKAYPASYPSVISVASVGSNNQRSSFSQYNNQVELSAPGGSIYSTYKSGYGTLSGTSMATPHVAGVIGLLRMYFPQCDVNAIRRVIAYTAKDLQTNNCDTQTGHGLIQAKTAYDRLALGNCGYLTGTTSGGGCYSIGAIATPKPTRKPTKKPTKPKAQIKKEKRAEKKGTIALYMF